MKLLELRKKKQISQTELAQILQIPQTTYSSYETKRANPDIDTLCKLADFYNCTLDELVERKSHLLNLEAIKPIKKKLIQYILEMNELQEIKTEAYLDGLMGD